MIRALTNISVLQSTASLQRTIIRFTAPMSSTTTNNTPGPVARSITDILQATFSPMYLDVINESHMHNVPKNSETHFKVVVVSEQFESLKGPVQRHRRINDALSEQLQGPVHALSIVAKSPTQWKSMVEAGQAIAPSPKCHGGDGSLPKKH